MSLPTVPITQEQKESLQRIAQRDGWNTQKMAQTILEHATTVDHL